MNRKEMNEVKKNFGGSDYCTTNRILTVFFDHEKKLCYKSSTPFIEIEGECADVYTDTLRRVLSSNIGKACVEYAFPNEAYEEGRIHPILYKLLKTGLEDDEAIDAFLNHLTAQIAFGSPFSLMIAHCTMSIRSRSRNDELDGEADNTYNYLVGAFCPAATGKDGFYFDADSGTVIKRQNAELNISRIPSDGFLFPVFSERTPDVNHIMYYSKKPSDPNTSIIEQVFGCEYRMTPTEEKNGLRDVIRAVVGDELDLPTMTAINDKLCEIVEENRRDTVIAEVDSHLLKNILMDSGVTPEKLECLDAVYEDKLGGSPLMAVNLAESRTVIAAPDITVNVRQAATDKIRATTLNGRPCLIITLDEPGIEVNGFELKLEEGAEQVNDDGTE